MKKNLFVLFILGALSGLKAQTLAVENCSYPTRGLYVLHATGVNGKNEYKAIRDFEDAVESEIIRWNPTANNDDGRWEVIHTTTTGSEVVAFSNDQNSEDNIVPPESGWTRNSGLCQADVRVYTPLDIRSVVDYGSWGVASTWSSNTIPRAYDNVTIESSVDLDTDGTCHNLTIGFAELVGDGTNILTVLGDVSKTSSFHLMRDIILKFGGDERQYLADFPEGGKFIIANPAGVSLTENLGWSIHGAIIPMDLVFESGNVYVGDYVFVVTSVSGAGPSSHVVIDGGGSFGINAAIPPHSSTPPYASTYVKEFPVGSPATGYNPIKITLQPNSASEGGSTIPFYQGLQFSVRASPLNQTPPHLGYVDVEWNITKTLSSAPGMTQRREGLFTVTFNWNEANEMEHFDREGAIVAKRYNTSTSTWENQGASEGLAVGTDPYSHTITDQNKFSPWAIFNTQEPLPVNLAYFGVREEEARAQLTWTTTSEDYFSHFEIERSFDGHGWKRIGQLNAKGGSSEGRRTPTGGATWIDGGATYHFSDPLARSNGSSSIRYYRLRMVDLDGSFDYSRIESLEMNASNLAVNVYPNPVTDYVTFDGVGVHSVEFYNTLGQIVMQRRVEAKQGVWVGGLPSGVYHLHIRGSDSGLEVRKVVVK